MIQYEYIEIIIIMKPDKIRLKYDLDSYMHRGYAYTQLRKGMYRLAQLGRNDHNQLVKILELFVYVPVSLMSGLCQHKVRPIRFTLSVDIF